MKFDNKYKRQNYKKKYILINISLKIKLIMNVIVVCNVTLYLVYFSIFLINNS